MIPETMPEIISNMIQLHPVRVERGEIEHLLLLRSDRVLYARGIWQVITGKIEPGETALEAARREMIEETGHEGSAWAALPDVATFYFEPTDQVILSPMLACLLPEGAEPRLSHEHTAFAWLGLAEAQERVPYPTQRHGMELVEKLFRHGL